MNGGSRHIPDDSFKSTAGIVIVRIAHANQSPATGSPEQFADTIRSAVARASKLIEDTGIIPER